ncbi:S8 family serine peptidase [Belliella sp. R4-6]|uniref:S8 family serine peptidase n=1 Tax=Belliella alkalica TaxID=1730871 RepID=A0ABS9V898_9BACT|nr:S8 family serine peptidase [Belliella alkalica]MCH7412180.1 S8 family serine peptidase [Belliella alkalica]
MRKNWYKFNGRNVMIAAFFFGLVASSCQETIEEPNLNSDLELASLEDRGKIIPGSYIVVLNPSSITFRKDGSYADVNALARKNAESILSKHRISINKLEMSYGSAIDGFAVKLTDSELSTLSKDPQVAFIEPDQIITIGQGRPGGGGGSTSPSQTIPYGISRVGGGQTYTGTKKAWVIDTGIQLNHPDLNVDQTIGFSAFTKGKDAGFDDKNGHGTHVAGTIGAIDNNIGVVGVAAGAIVVPIKVLDSRGSGSNAGVIAGVDFVSANANSGDVANMSLGGGASTALDNAVISASNKGIKFVIAAGNSGADSNNFSPARVNGANIYTISAMNSSDSWASFSNFGNPPIDYCAPGVSINSTWISSGYRSISGTSMAAPHAAGVLMWGNPNTDGFVIGDPDGNPDPIITR